MHDDRDWRLCRLSWLIFSGLKEYFALCTRDTAPHLSWANARWLTGPWHKWRKKPNTDVAKDADILKKMLVRACNQSVGETSFQR